MATTATPIETTYQGVRFRSRTEARWAICFDALGLSWEYEPEGYETEAGFYLPDFYVRELGAFWEVKGVENAGGEKAEALVRATGKPIVLAVGQPREQVNSKIEWAPYLKVWAQRSFALNGVRAVVSSDALLTECENCGAVQIMAVVTEGAHAQFAPLAGVKLLRCDCGASSLQAETKRISKAFGAVAGHRFWEGPKKTGFIRGYRG